MKKEVIFGFGFMRLPEINGEFDYKQIEKMVDMFIDNGYTYFDTAYIYKGSEEALYKVLVSRYQRNKYRIATKLPLYLINSENSMHDLFSKSIDRLKVDYVDYYLLHGIDEFWSKRAEELGAWEYLNELKRDNLVKSIGFSFHGTPQELDNILIAHPTVDFVQLQINYIDWNDQKIQSRRMYEIARSHNKEIIIMEPVKGGLLSNEDISCFKYLKTAGDGASLASWALRFAASLEGVSTVLSGMSSLDQMRDNIATMNNLTPLTVEEMEVLSLVIQKINDTPRLDCTGCKYCVQECTMHIKIPILISLYNEYLLYNSKDNFKHMYDMYTEDGTKANTCLKCKKCEERCPQNIEISDIINKISILLDH